MIVASPVPVIVGAIMRARRKIAAHFFAHHAVSAEDAVPFVPQRPIERRQFDMMKSRGVVREAGAGKFWLDTAAYQAEIDRRRRIMVPIVIVACVVIAGLIMLLYRDVKIPLH